MTTPGEGSEEGGWQEEHTLPPEPGDGVLRLTWTEDDLEFE